LRERKGTGEKQSKGIKMGGKGVGKEGKRMSSNVT